MPFMCKTFLTFANARHGILNDFKNQLIKTTKIFTHVVIKKFQKKLLKQPKKQPNK